MGSDTSGMEPIWEDERFLRALVENTSEGLLTIDADSQILFANPAIEGILGYEPAELVGCSKMTIIPERLRPAHREGLEQYLQTGERHIDWTGVELPALHKEGHEVPVSVSLREHEYDGERLFTGVFTDVTERTRRERRLRRQRQELEEFADVLTHDLRNPLSVAKGYLGLVSEDCESEDVEQALAALDRMDQIIDDTLAETLYGPAARTTEVMPFADLVRTAWESVQTEDAALVAPAPRWTIRASEGRLCQLFENLFVNAAEYAGPSATVRVAVLEDQRGFFVADDGPGLSESLQMRLETPSGLTRDRGDGYGLQIVEKIADEHGWEMHVTDAADGGARFEFVGATIAT